MSLGNIKKPRVLFAGYEIGGQMQLMAETLRSRGYAAKAASFNTDYRQYRTDIFIPHQKLPINRFLFAQQMIRQFDVFHFFWGVSLLDFWKFYGLDLPILKALKKKIVVHFRGTDLINPDHYYYQSHEVEQNRPPRSRPIQLRKLAHWRKYADKILVSTPNLLEIAGENAILVPQVIDLQEWNPSPINTNDKTIRVAHAPTRRAIKGTDLIIRAIENLKDKGLPVELILIENLTHHETKAALQKADIGVDQLILGWYGRVAIEFMALEKPVICYIDPKYSKYRKDLPLVQADVNSLSAVLERLIGDEALRKQIGQQSV